MQGSDAVVIGGIDERRHTLEPAGHTGQSLDAAGNRFVLAAASISGTRSCEDVVHVHLAAGPLRQLLEYPRRAKQIVSFSFDISFSAPTITHKL